MGKSGQSLKVTSYTNITTMSLLRLIALQQTKLIMKDYGYSHRAECLLRNPATACDTLY
jgi:hypothetical protein